MGTSTRELATPGVEDRYPELVAVVQDTWCVEDPARAAGKILERDTDVDDLLGVLESSDVLQYHHLSNTVDTLEFGEKDGFGVDARRFRDAASNPEHYIVRADRDWAWLHPRYRWLLGATP